jgi:hypothetical protein
MEELTNNHDPPTLLKLTTAAGGNLRGTGTTRRLMMILANEI